MLHNMPTNPLDLFDWSWESYRPLVEQLTSREFTPENLGELLADWTSFEDLLTEVYERLYVASVQDTTDKVAEARMKRFYDEVFPNSIAYNNVMNEKLIASGLKPEGFEVPLRNALADMKIFRKENLPLISEERKLGMGYEQIISMQTVMWEGEEVTLTELANLALNRDRATREKAWRLGSQRVLQDRDAINEIWTKLLPIRDAIGKNAGMSYRDFIWHGKYRFDYTPADCETFHAAIEEVVVPAVNRVYERRRKALGVDTFRPWDLSANPMRATDTGVVPEGTPPIKPFSDVKELEEAGQRIFDHVDPVVGGYYRDLRDHDLIDFPNRKGKGPGAFCVGYPVLGKPFIFLNSTGTHEDVGTLLHECGHAFHVYQAMGQPYHQLRYGPMEFNEVASMSMELLASPYLTKEQGGFYDEATAARARIDHIEGMLIFWPYMAVVDAFQHWVYSNVKEALDPANCDAKWSELWDRFIGGVDYSGLEPDKVTGWHRKVHIFTYPFYYVEYGLAQLGAVQIFGNARRDQKEAVKSYLAALALGGSKPLPELFRTAGATFGFNADILRRGVDIFESTIAELAPLAGE